MAASTDSRQASVLFARFIWEAVEKEVSSAKETRTIVNSLYRDRCERTILAYLGCP